MKISDSKPINFAEELTELAMEHIRGLNWPDSRLAGMMDQLTARLSKLGSALTAFSGGVDSSLLAVVAHAALGEKSLAATAVSALLPGADLAAAKRIANLFGLRHVCFEHKAPADPEFRLNRSDRCYRCKTILCSQLRGLADRECLIYILDGSNVDDAYDFRPGMRAAKECGLISPLAEADFTKADIRQAARVLGLPNADKPASACLASRLPYGRRLDEAEMRAVDECEEFLRGMGFVTARVRLHGDVARLELGVGEIERAAGPAIREKIVEFLQTQGFQFVALDMQGYRQGSLNDLINGRPENGAGI